MNANKQSLLDKIFRGMQTKVFNSSFTRVNTKLQFAKKKLIDGILAHIVSAEISSGIGANNVSGTLGGYGNLFSFIGFDNNSSPIDDLVSFLENSIELKNNPVLNRKGFVSMSVSVPSRKDFDLALPLPWENGISWPHAIENGIGNLGHFLSRLDIGRSSGGLQVKNELSARTFSPVDYITPLLNQFEIDLRS